MSKQYLKLNPLQTAFIIKVFLVLCMTYLLLYKQQENMSSRCSSNLEISASELLDKLEDMFLLYNMDSDQIQIFKHTPVGGSTRKS